MSVCLVTGSNGFIGSNLVDHLLSLGNTVVALARGVNKPRPMQGGQQNKLGSYIAIAGDVLDRNLIFKLFDTYNFNEVYHLAGQSSPSLSWKQPAQTMEVNFSGTINILDGVLKADRAPSVVLVSSSAVYSPQQDATPIKESGECKPVTPYGVSKLAMDQLASIYSAAYGMKVMSARPFFIIGPGKLNDVCSDWARNIVMIERGNLNSLSVGAVTGIARDFLSIPDAVSALCKIAEKGIRGEAYNVCSGNAILLSTVLEILKNHASTSIAVEVDQAKFRPIEELIKVGNNDKLSSLSWVHKKNIENCLVDILDYWRQNP